MKGFGKMTSLSSALRGALEQRGLDRGIRQREILQRWKDIVGETIARQAEPRHISNGVLWLRVIDATWRMELHGMRAELAKMINDAAGEQIIQEVRVQ
jgi:predicted nucleic acid-binding Zn ribbon protein